MGSDDHDDTRRGFDFNGGGDKYNINGRILLTAVLCLFFVVILVILLHIYARCVLRRQARRRQALRQLNMGVMASQVQPNEAPRSGLDPSVIATMPIFMYKELDSVDKSVECSVCLSVLGDEEMARILPNCKHMFHAECIDMWLGAHSTCPICRTDAEPQAAPEPVAVQATAPPLESENSTAPTPTAAEATAPPLESMNSMGQCSDCAINVVAQSAKVSGSSSRLSSFRRMLSRDRSERRVHIQTQPNEERDIERQ